MAKADEKHQPAKQDGRTVETAQPSTRTTTTTQTEQAVTDPTIVQPGEAPEAKTGQQDGHNGSPEAK